MNKENMDVCEKTFIEQIDAYVINNLDCLKKLIIQLCQIPSPTGSEEKKAVLVKEQLKHLGLKKPYIDEAGNVIYLHGSDQSNRMIIFNAHIDTVFMNTEKIDPVISGNKLYAPSSGDNSANAAALILILKMVKDLDIRFKQNILFVWNVGEEGLGNLKGIRHIVDKYREQIDAVIAVDGYYDGVVNHAVGSKRYSIKIKTEGGHSWGAFGSENAIFHASKIINELYSLQVPTRPKTTYNVGIIKGGTSVNTIAEDAEFLVDLRSEAMDSLEKLDSELIKIVWKELSKNVSIDMSLVGDRPCGYENFHNMLEETIQSVRNDMGMDTVFHSSSTDANIPLSVGIPAISFGICRGEGAHTLKESIELDSLEKGMQLLARFLIKFI